MTGVVYVECDECGELTPEYRGDTCARCRGDEAYCSSCGDSLPDGREGGYCWRCADDDEDVW